MRGAPYALLGLLVLAASPPAPAGEEGKTVEIAALLSGKVVKWKARRLHLEYDVASEDLLKDFEVTNPFAATMSGEFTVRDGALRARGTVTLLSKILFEADLSVVATVKSPTPNDVGVAMIPPDLSQTFLIFSLADTYFSARDRQPLRQHMITVVGAEDDPGSAGGIAFRYLNRTRQPALQKDVEIPIEALKRGDRNRFVFGDSTLDAADRYGRFESVQPALFVLQSEIVVTKLEIRGKVAESWLEKRKVAWDRTEKDDEVLPEIESPKDGTAPAPPAGENRPPRPAWRPEGEGAAADLVRTLKDERATVEDREAAAKGLTKDNVKLDALRGLIDCLMSDDETTRTLAIGVLKKITGKTLGYHPKAPEDARKEGFRAWFKYMMENRERYRE